MAHYHYKSSKTFWNPVAYKKLMAKGARGRFDRHESRLLKALRSWNALELEAIHVMPLQLTLRTSRLCFSACCNTRTRVQNS